MPRPIIFGEIPGIEENHWLACSAPHFAIPPDFRASQHPAIGIVSIWVGKRYGSLIALKFSHLRFLKQQDLLWNKGNSHKFINISNILISPIGIGTTSLRSVFF